MPLPSPSRVGRSPDVGRVYATQPTGTAGPHSSNRIVAPLSLQVPPEGTNVPVVVRGPPGPPDTWHVNRNGSAFTIGAEPILGLTSLLNVRDAVRMGVGAARLPISLVSGDIAAGRLSLWGDVQGSDIRLWALYPSRRLLSARVSAFLDHLREAFPDGSPEALSAYIDC